MVVVRPDQYVAMVLRMEESAEEVERFFEGCLCEQGSVVNGVGKH